VVECCLVEDEEVGCACENIVDEDTEEPVMALLVADLDVMGGSAYHVMRYNVNACRRQSSRDHWLM
jgi:hypothetical protein